MVLDFKNQFKIYLLYADLNMSLYFINGTCDEAQKTPYLLDGI